MSNYHTNFYFMSTAAEMMNQSSASFAFGSGSRNTSLGLIESSSTNTYHQSVHKVTPLTPLVSRLESEERIEEISCGETISAFLTDRMRVFIAGDSRHSENSIQHFIIEVDTSAIKDEEKYALIRQVCVAGESLFIITESGNVWVKYFTQNEENTSLKRMNYGNNEKIQYVSTGISHTMALSTSKNLYASGYSSYGSFGDGMESTYGVVNRTDSKQVVINMFPGETIRDVYAAYYRTLVTSSEGNLYVTGWGVYNQQGIGEDSSNLLSFILHQPMKDLGVKVAKVALGALHTICLAYDGKVYGFGFNSYGQLANPKENEPLPIEIKLPFLTKDIHCGWHYSVFVASSGELYSCGANTSGEQAAVSEEKINFRSPMKMNMPVIPNVTGSSINWRVYTSSFSSNTFLLGRVSNKRIIWMQSKMKEFSNQGICFPDLLVTH